MSRSRTARKPWGLNRRQCDACGEAGVYGRGRTACSECGAETVPAPSGCAWETLAETARAERWTLAQIQAHGTVSFDGGEEELP